MQTIVLVKFICISFVFYLVYSYKVFYFHWHVQLIPLSNFFFKKDQPNCIIIQYKSIFSLAPEYLASCWNNVDSKHAFPCQWLCLKHQGGPACGSNMLLKVQKPALLKALKQEMSPKTQSAPFFFSNSKRWNWTHSEATEARKHFFWVFPSGRLCILHLKPAEEGAVGDQTHFCSH